MREDGDLLESNDLKHEKTPPSSLRKRVVMALVMLGVTLLGANILFLHQSIGTDAQSSLATLILKNQDAVPSWLQYDRAQFARDLWIISQQIPQQQRGLVIPLYDDIAALGKSLMLELRSLGVDLPIEVPHCGDLPENQQQMLLRDDPLIRIYNVCEEAEQAHTTQGKPFCENMNQCHSRFRSFDIKLLAVVFSRFQEMMIMDADTIYFHNPMALWENDKYKATGTLFFHDRMSQDDMFLSDLMPDQGNVTKFQHYMANFDVEPYRSLPTIDRVSNSKGLQSDGATPAPVQLPFKPSDFFLASHSWNRRAGHEMESSLVLWNKVRQPRATAILASFASLANIGRPPSYGEKELFFIACELAETAYAFSDFGIGGVGWDLRTIHHDDTGIDDSVVCGDVVHFYPVQSAAAGATSKLNALAGSPLFTNGETVFKWDLSEKQIFRTKARPAEYYPGSFTARNMPQECPFNVTVLPLTAQESARMLLRHSFIGLVETWLAPSISTQA